MKDTEYTGPKKLADDLPEFETRSMQLTNELLELRSYVKHLSAYVEKYNGVKDNLTRENKGASSISVSESKWQEKKGLPYTEMGCSVKEEFGEFSPVEVIELAPPEEVLLISGNKKRTKSEEKDVQELSSVVSNPVGQDDSQIGIYYIEHVKPVNFVNVLQRELSTLGRIFPDVKDIIKQITREFDHFKMCQKCLGKVRPLLPDILKELQELIKYIRKKRNEVYVWPDDSEYLRKISKPFRKQVGESERRKIRQETVGFVTVHTNTPQIMKKYEANIRSESRTRENSGQTWKCLLGASDGKQLNYAKSMIQTDLTQTKKAEMAEAEIPLQKERNSLGEKSFLTEFSTSQVLKTLHPGLAFQTVVQYRVQGNIEHLVNEMHHNEHQSNKALPDNERIQKRSTASEMREFLLNAKSALGRACLELGADSESNSDIRNELKTGIENLKSLMLEVYQNQMELRNVVMEKEVRNPAIVELTDPLVLREEREGMRWAQVTMHEATLDSARGENLQCMIDELKSKCEMKNRLIMSLLRGLRSNVPWEEWEELITGVIQDSLTTQLRTEKKSDSIKESTWTVDRPQNVLTGQAWSPYILRRSSDDEISSERELAATTYEQGIMPGRSSARVFFPEKIPIKYESLSTVEGTTRQDSPLQCKSSTAEDFNVETEKLFKELENEVHSLTLEHNKLLCEIEELKKQRSATSQKQDDKTVGSGSRALNVTIKIGDRDSVSGYYSALSVVPSGASLKEKKSQLSFPLNFSELSHAPETGHSIRGFISAVSLSKEERVKRQHDARKSTKSYMGMAFKLKLPEFFYQETRHAPGVIFQHATKPENHLPASLDSGTAVCKSKQSKSCCEDFPDFDLDRDLHTINPSKEEFIVPEFHRLHPQMNVHCEQSETIKKLRSRLRFLDRDMHSLEVAIDRMDNLTEKLLDDAFESSQNFKHVYDTFCFLRSRSRI